MQIDDLIRAVEADAPDTEPLTLLRTASSMVQSVTDAADAALGYFVDQARRAGHSWTEIGSCLGVSKQAAQQKHVRVSSDLAAQSMERFTPRARAVVERFEEVARGLGHSFIGTEHILLALYSQPKSMAALILRERGLSASKAKEAVLEMVPSGEPSTTEVIALTPRAQDVMIGTMAEALKLGHNYIGTEHMLLALYRNEGAARQVLEDAGLDNASVVGEVKKRLAGLK